jgi:hypothetical protein
MLKQRGGVTRRAVVGPLRFIATMLRRGAPPLPLCDVEFVALHADAGAPEGALFANGEFVGVITGVDRL